MTWMRAGRRPWSRGAMALAAGFVLVTAVPASAAGTWTYESGNTAGGHMLMGVSCLPSGWCSAVGLRYDEYGRPRAFAKTGNGAKWTIVPVANPPHSDLQSVSCVAPNWCQAVGSSKNTTRALTEHWNGKAWTAQPSPNALGTLAGVSCTSRSFCMAVGTAVARWNGKKWGIVPTPRKGTGTHLESVSCLSWKWCVAVGTYSTKGPQHDFLHTLAEVWNGKVWKIVPTPTPTGRAELIGVDCVSTSWCMAVGNGATATPIQHWNGRSWTVMAHPLASSKDLAVRGISCASQTSCVIVGDGPLSEQWNGTAWSTMADPGGDLPPTYWLGVSCFTGTRCKAVGEGTSVYVTG